MSDSRSLEELYLVHKVEPDEIVETFDCGDADLNDFIKNSATNFRKQLLAVTYVLASRENPNEVIGYCSLANDIVALSDFDSATQFNRFRREQGFPNSKRLKSYPAIKVCRLGVDLATRNRGAGRLLLNYVKTLFTTDPKSGCRFVTVDAYIDAIPFYEKNGFHLLDDKEIDKSDFTRIMYFDLKRIS